MRKGISLITLIITIIVVIILAGSVVLNLYNTNIIDNASEAVEKNDQDVLASRKNLFEMEVMLAQSGNYDAAKVLYYEVEGKYYYDEDINGNSVTTDDGNGNVTVNLDSSILVEDYNGKVIEVNNDSDAGEEEVIVDNPIDNVNVTYPDEYANLFDGDDSTYYVSSDSYGTDYITLNEDLSGKYMCIEYIMPEPTEIDEYSGGSGMGGHMSNKIYFTDNANNHIVFNMNLEYSIDESTIYCADFNNGLEHWDGGCEAENWIVGIAAVPQNANKIEIDYNLFDSRKLVIKRINFYNSLIDISGYEKAQEIIDIDNGSIIIPDYITIIGSHAFYGCDSLTSVEIPNDVTSIGNSAFSDCNGLTSVEIPSSVTNIGNYAFACCHGLTSVNIPTGVTSIGCNAFYYCDSLPNIEIPDTVTTIGSYAFYGCDSFPGFEIPATVVNRGIRIFYFDQY